METPLAPAEGAVGAASDRAVARVPRGAVSPRLAHLDALRGVAIAMVVLFHAYAAWIPLYPYGARFAGSIVDTKGTGVYLFFMISGFVIFMSLDKSAGLASFLYRRWKRLFPAMLVCSLAVFPLAATVSGWPRGTAGPLDLLPGLTLFGEDTWRWLTGLDADHLSALEGAFWSLFVEVRFYLVVGIVWFAVSRRAALWVLPLLYALLHVFRVLNLASVRANPWVSVEPVILIGGKIDVYACLQFLGAPYLLWFFAGAMYFVWERGRRERDFAIASIAALVCALSPTTGSAPRLFVVALFAATLRWPAMQRWVANPVLLFLGFVSYPLYLLHENMLVTMIVRLGAAAPWLPAWTLPLAPITVVVILGWLVARWAEPFARRAIVAGLERRPVRG